MSPRKPSSRLISLLTIVFFFSGFASLIYQVVWQRLLTLFYGVGSVSTTLIVGVYMAGLGAGGLVGGILAERLRRRVLAYFWVELLVGLFGLFSLGFISLLGRATAGSPYALSALYMFLFLSIPTFLMGLTLPLLTKIFNRYTHNFAATVSLLYFINTIGAAVGALFASYFLISLFGLDTAIYTAAVIDLGLALAVFLAGRPAQAHAADPQSFHSEEERPGGLGRLAYLVVFVTGFLALGYEIIWYRMISVLVKDSPYAFSSILAVYLLGVALGSLVVNKLLARRPHFDRKNLFFLVQFLIGLYVLVAVSGGYYLTRDTSFGALARLSFSNMLHPDPDLLLYLPKRIPSFALLYASLDIFLWPFLFLFIPTFLMGAGFPLVSSLAMNHGDQEGRTVGTVYFFNILGNVFGSVVTGFLILPALGSEVTLLALALTSMLGLLFVTRWQRPGRRPSFTLSWRAALLSVIFALGIAIFPGRGDYYRLIHPPAQGSHEIIGEGVDNVVVTYYQDGPTTDYINGIAHGQFGTEWYYAWVTEAAAYAPSLDNVLVIGFGSGTFPDVLRKLDGLGQVTIVELSPTVMRNRAGIPFYQEMLSDPRVHLVIDDGRRFLLRTGERYDLILMDPLPTTTAYANNLHSRDFFELARQHLKPGGVFLIGGLNEKLVVSKTIAAVFPYDRAYNLFTLGSDAPLVKNAAREQQIFDNLNQVKRDLVATYIPRNYLGDQAYIQARALNYPINDAWKPYTEYYLGLRYLERLHILK